MAGSNPSLFDKKGKIVPTTPERFMEINIDVPTVKPNKSLFVSSHVYPITPTITATTEPINMVVCNCLFTGSNHLSRLINPGMIT